MVENKFSSETVHTIQTFTSSSLPSVQSLYPLQTNELIMHRPELMHLNGLSDSHFLFYKIPRNMLFFNSRKNNIRK